jgi:hypothetical protein
MDLSRVLPAVDAGGTIPQGNMSNVAVNSSGKGSSGTRLGVNSGGREMRLCGVCGDITERKHLNYGGEACFSCRYKHNLFFLKGNCFIVNFIALQFFSHLVNEKNESDFSGARYVNLCASFLRSSIVSVNVTHLYVKEG